MLSWIYSSHPTIFIQKGCLVLEKKNNIIGTCEGWIEISGKWAMIFKPEKKESVLIPSQDVEKYYVKY